MMRVPFNELRDAVAGVMRSLGLEPERAELSARLTAETDCDGVRTHGIARLPRFAQAIRDGVTFPTARPECVGNFGTIERWTGHRGPGNLAAYAAMQRATELAAEHGLGAVALADTSHWMRAGTYGWQAVGAGCAALCWTNTMPNLPPWGATSPALGNNPLVVAIPHTQPIVLDIAMSQFSFGTLERYRRQGKQLPVPGGFDEDGSLTTDPAAIEQSGRALPVGYWKGSGLSFVLDVLAAMLSGGKATHEIPSDAAREAGVSQVFLAISPTSLSSVEDLRKIAEGAIGALHSADPIEEGRRPRYPGEGTLATREENMRLGVPVDEEQWRMMLELGR